jgi:hypothetical protein
LDAKRNQSVGDVPTQNIFPDEPSRHPFFSKIELLSEASFTGFSPCRKNLNNKRTKKAASWNDALEGEREDIPKRQL